MNTPYYYLLLLFKLFHVHWAFLLAMLNQSHTDTTWPQDPVNNSSTHRLKHLPCCNFWYDEPFTLRFNPEYFGVFWRYLLNKIVFKEFLSHCCRLDSDSIMECTYWDPWSYFLAQSWVGMWAIRMKLTKTLSHFSACLSQKSVRTCSVTLI
jgi:hypothetical protein